MRSGLDVSSCQVSTSPTMFSFRLLIHVLQGLVFLSHVNKNIIHSFIHSLSNRGKCYLNIFLRLGCFQGLARALELTENSEMQNILTAAMSR